MKRKIVIKVSVNGDEARSKVLQIAVSITGVESAALGENQVVVVGEERVDPAELTLLLRKKLSNWPRLACFLKSKLAYAEIVSVEPVDNVETKSKPKEEETNPNPIPWQYGPPPPSNPYYVCYPYDDPCRCSIM